MVQAVSAEGDQETRTVRTRHTRPTIAYLAPTVHSGNRAQWSGVVDAAQRHDVNLLCFPGWSLHDRRGFQAQSNIVYDLANTEAVQGLVIWTSSIGNYVDVDEISAFCARFHPRPLVSIGRVLPNTPSLVMDSYEGIREAVAHLIEVHGCRHIAFIRGPEHHPYAQERYRAYTEALEAYGIPHDPRLVTSPLDWALETGQEMMQMLLDERELRPQTDFQAVMAANDALLLGGLDVLTARGVRIPGDVAAVGFNYTPEGQANTPPLTSVAAPFVEAGARAVETLLALMEGAKVPEQVTVPSRLMVHQSCGCRPLAASQAAATPEPLVDPSELDQMSLADALAAARAEIVAEMVQAVATLGTSPDPTHAEALFDSLVADLEDESAGTFLASLDGILRQALITGNDVSAWHGGVSVLRSRFLPYLDRASLVHAGGLWQQARVLIGDAAQRLLSFRRFQVAQQAQALADVGASLITAFDQGELIETLMDGLPRLGIPSACLALYEDPQPYTYPQPAPAWSYLVMAYNESGRSSFEGRRQGFSTRQLLPGGTLSQDVRTTAVVEPLYFAEQQLGFVLLGVGPLDGAVYHNLRGQISSALQGALLIQQVKEHALQLDTAVAETLTTVQEMQVTVLGASEQAREMASAAQQSLEVSLAGQAAVVDTVTGMEAIQLQVKGIVENIQALSSRTEQIGGIIDAVQRIADRSQLLALNARIEAAHAGKAGLGFAVVAKEMRELADQSKEATSRIRNMLTEIQRATETAVVATHEGGRGAEDGVKLANRAGEAIRDLSAIIDKAAQAATHIVSASDQQNAGMDQLAQAMQSIKQASSQTAEGVARDG